MTQRRVKNTATSNSDPEAADVELYMSPDGAISLPVRVEGDTVWATQAQMAELFGALHITAQPIPNEKPCRSRSVSEEYLVLTRRTAID